MGKKWHKGRQKKAVSLNTEIIDIYFDFYKEISDQISDTVVITDTDFKIININKSAEKLLNSKEIDLIGLHYFERTKIPFQHNELDLISKTILNGKSWMGEYNVNEGNGLVKYLQIKISPVRDRDEIIIASLIITKDITDEKKSREAILALEKSEEKFRTLANRLPVGVYRTTLSGKIIYANSALAKILGYESIEELYKLDIEKNYVNIDDRVEQINRAVNKESIIELENLLFKKNGEKVWVRDTTRVVYDDLGNIEIFDGIIEDITEKKLAEIELINAKEKAEESEKLKTNFLSNMSHELRTPMIGILGYSQIMQEEFADNSAVLDMAAGIYDSGARLLETLNLILDLSRIEAGKVDLNYSVIDIVNVINEVKTTFEAMARRKNLDFKAIFPFAKFEAKLDERLLREILNNLVNNAIKYTKHGNIKIVLSELIKDEKRFAVIKVIDSGVGISKEAFSVIFEEFRQASEGFSRSFEGTGLGLTITKNFVEKMNGTIDVESEIGVGSTFTITLPVDYLPYEIFQPDSIVQKNENSFEITDFDSGNLLVLSVEDDAISADFIVKFLKGIALVDSVKTGLEALDMVKHKQYELVLMDINLGKGMNGIETTQKIRKISGYDDIPIIAVTAFAMVGDKEEFILKGCTDYISKPFKKLELIDIVKKYIVKGD